MVKATEQNDKLNRAVVISIILHLILFGLLIWGSFVERSEESAGGGGEGSVVGAVMVDPNAMVEQYKRQQQHINAAQTAQQQSQKRAEQQAKELQEKQAEQQQRLKALEQERLAAQEKAAEVAAAKIKLEAEKAAAEQAAAKAKQEAAKAAAEQAAAKAQLAAEKAAAEQAAAKAKQEAAKAAAEQAAAKAKLEAQKKAAEQAAAKAKQEAAKAAAEQAAAKEKQEAAKAAAKAKQEAKKAAQAKQEQEVDDLFGGLANSKNAPKNSGALHKGDGKPTGQGNAKNAGANGVDLSNYKSQIRAAIQSKFYDPSVHIGKTCELQIKLAPDGLLIDVQAVGGDAALCEAAISAAKSASIPKPPSDQVYEYFKHSTLEFKPQ